MSRLSRLSRLGGLGPHLSAAAAILIAATGCSSSTPSHGGSGGAATGGGAGALGSSGQGGVVGAGGAARSGGSGSVASTGGAAGGASGGITGNAGANGGMTGNAGTGGPAGKCLGNDVDLRATTVSGKVTVNGAAIAPSTNTGGSFFLRRGEGKGLDQAFLASTSPTGGSYTALVFPGTYDLYYGGTGAGIAVPINSLAKLRSGIVVGASPLSLDLDVSATTVSGTVTVNGGAVKLTEDTGYSAVSLVNAAGDTVDLLSTTPTGSFTARVVPGTYDVYYGNLTQGIPLPTNTSARLQAGLIVGTSPLSLTIDVPAPVVSGTITINGAAVAHPAQRQGTLTLTNAAGDKAALPTYTAATGAYSGRVVPGTYDVYWNGSGPDVPGNTAIKVQGGVVVGATGLSFSVDIPATTISGTVAVAGATAMQLSQLTAATSYFKLRGAGDDTVPLTITAAGTYSARAVPGTYDLYFGTPSAALVSAPRNTAAKLQGGIVLGASPLTLNINVPAVTVSGTATLNGAAIAASGQNAFVLTLRNAAGDRATLASYPTDGAFSVTVIPGTYDLYYARQGNLGTVLPNNGLAKLRGGIVVGTSPVVLDVDIRGTAVTGAITVNGAATPGASGDLAFVTLFDEAGNATLLTGAASATGTYSTFVLPGAYQLSYVLLKVSGTTLPSNSNAPLGCFIVP